MAKRIGEFLLDLGVLTEKQVNEILRHAKSTGTRFGESAVRLGILRNEAPIKAFGTSFSVDFFHLNPKYFPEGTKDVLSVDSILKFGSLPLGTKTTYKFFRERKTLNVGFLDPTRKDAIKAVEEEARRALGDKFGSLKVYLILADEFLDVIERVYHLEEEAIRSRSNEQLDPMLHSFLESIYVNPS